MKKTIIRVLSVVLVVAMIAGCGGGATSTAPAAPAASGAAPAAPAAPAKEKPKNLVIASGNSGGTYYYIGAGQAKILTDKLGNGYSVTTESTSGSPVENGTFVQEDAGTLGIITLDGLYEGLAGSEARGFMDGPIDNATLIQVGHDLILYCVTLQGNGIESIADLKGKKISLPTVGNTAYFQAVGILEQYGITLNDCTATPMVYSEAADALKDGTLDAVWIAGGIPQAAVTDLDTTKDIKLLTIDENMVSKITDAYPYWGIKTLPGGTYSDQKEDINIMVSTVVMAANKNLDDDLVYNITKILNESVDELAGIHANGADWNADATFAVMEQNIVPVHPGAQRYYDEIAK